MELLDAKDREKLRSDFKFQWISKKSVRISDYNWIAKSVPFLTKISADMELQKTSRIRVLLKMKCGFWI